MENIQRATPQKFSNAVYRHFHIYTMGMLFYTRQERLDYFFTRAPNILFTLHTHTFQLCFIYLFNQVHFTGITWPTRSAKSKGLKVANAGLKS